MPLLGLEPSVYPDDLLDGAAPGHGDSWWVLHTRPRAEKALARGLYRLKQTFFLPLYKKQWRGNGRLVTSHLPLFPAYVFLRGDGDARLAALQTNHVARTLDVLDGGALRADLARVHELIRKGLPLTPEERLQPGSPVTITAGPLAGLEGKVLRRDKRTRFVVEVHFIQRGASVEVEGWLLEPRAPPAGQGAWTRTAAAAGGRVGDFNSR
jgi:transcriptional antiterminator RfaH